jgi:ferric-dicitrate binding protein FerR (iron transport regulator)
VRAGDELRSGAGGRAALELGGLSLRMDEHSTIELLAADRVALRKGALYVDAEPGAAESSLVVETALGTLEHLGTQYESRLEAGDLRVSVREGRVRITAPTGTLEGAAGEQLTIGADGRLGRGSMPVSGPRWGWVAEIAPPFELEDRRLDEFLRWVGRESGREVIFANPPAAAEAERVILRGSTRGLTPERALDAVLSTTRLDYEQAPGRLVIGFRAGDDR